MKSLAGVIKPSSFMENKCYTADIPKEHIEFGVNTDLIVYVTA